MQGKLIIGAIALWALSPSEAMATQGPKRLTCWKSDQAPGDKQAQRPQAQQQQRSRSQDCRTMRIVPPVVDPTPLFLL